MTYNRRTAKWVFLAVIGLGSIIMLGIGVTSARKPKKAGLSPPAKAEEPRARERALDNCTLAVERRAQYPSKADLLSVQDLQSGFQVTGKIDLMNGLGVMIPHSFFCETSKDGGTVLLTYLVPEGSEGWSQ
jgi:hypothetical protein